MTISTIMKDLDSQDLFEILKAYDELELTGVLKFKDNFHECLVNQIREEVFNNCLQKPELHKYFLKEVYIRVLENNLNLS